MIRPDRPASIGLLHVRLRVAADGLACRMLKWISSLFAAQLAMTSAADLTAINLDSAPGPEVLEDL